MESVLAAPDNTADDDLLTREQVERIVVELKEAAQLDYRERIPLGDGNVPSEHKTVFVRALNNVLSTELTVITFAQIVDGLPIAEVAFDRVDEAVWPDDGHPVEEHEELCPGALDKARELRKAWESEYSTLKFHPKVCVPVSFSGKGQMWNSAR